MNTKPNDYKNTEITIYGEKNEDIKMDSETKGNARVHFKNILEILKKYVISSFIDSLIIGGANFIFMLIMGMPHKILISIVVGLVNIIPNFGPVIGAAFGGILLIFNDIKQTIFFLIFTVILQILDGFLIKPKLFGKSFGISGFLMLIASLAAGAFFGIIGLLLVVPVVAIINYLFKNIILPNINKKDETEDSDSSS